MTNIRSNCKFLDESKKNHLIKSIAVTYIPILLIMINVLVFHNVIIGLVATSAFLILNGSVVYEKLKSVLGEIKWIGITLGAFIFLVSICVISSPFVLFSAFSLEHLVVIVAISGIPIVVFRIRDNLPVNPIIFQKMEKINRYDLGLIAIWISLLILDIFVLSSNTTSDSTFLWKRIPLTHLYVFFIFLLVTGGILFRKISISVRSVIITASIIFACSYAVIVVPTLYSNDTWFLLGEIRGALNHDHLYVAQNTLVQNISTVSLGPFKIPEQYLTVWSRGISNTLGLYTSQLLSDGSLTFWRLLSPVFALGTTAVILFRIGHLVSKKYLFSLLLPFSFLFYSGLTYYMSQTVKLSLYAFFRLGPALLDYFFITKRQENISFCFDCYCS
ncbi:hypothetical protein [Candidatus Nitrosotalea okcheonensis]|nr:hypothetical protein [Candidatus Nitrosotalea okcheonensis]